MQETTRKLPGLFHTPRSRMSIDITTEESKLTSSKDIHYGSGVRVTLSALP